MKEDISLFDLCDLWGKELIKRDIIDFKAIATNDKKNYDIIKKVVDQLHQDGYVIQHGITERFTFNGQGQIFLAKGGYKKLHCDENKANKLKEDLDKAVKNVSNFTIITGVLTSIIAAVTVWYIVKDYYRKDAQGEIRLQLQQTQTSIEQIKEQLKQIQKESHQMIMAKDTSLKKH